MSYLKPKKSELNMEQVRRLIAKILNRLGKENGEKFVPVNNLVICETGEKTQAVCETIRKTKGVAIVMFENPRAETWERILRAGFCEDY